MIHDFSTVKFALPFATVPFALAPVLIVAFFGSDLTRLCVAHFGRTRSGGSRRTDLRWPVPMAVLLLVLVAIAYTAREHPRFHAFFPQPNPEYTAIGGFLGHETEYRDIVFSPTLEIKSTPPQQLAYAMKMVYRVDSVAAIRQKLDTLGDADYVVDLLVPSDEAIAAPDLRRLAAAAHDIRKNEDYRLYKVSRAEFTRQNGRSKRAGKPNSSSCTPGRSEARRAAPCGGGDGAV